MSITKSSVRLASLAAVLLLASTASAQHPRTPQSSFDTSLFQPIVDPAHFDPDWQFFAPAELGDFGVNQAAKHGWFVQYARMYVWVSRPEADVPVDLPNAPVNISGSSAGQGDFTWGNRIDIGYMSESDHGWTFSGTNIKGLRSVEFSYIERVDRFNDDDDPNEDGGNQQGGGGQGGGGGGQNQTMAIFPVSDRNNIDTFARDFESVNTLNVANISGFELNKTFRLDRLHNGSYLEPFFGFRYISFADFHRRDAIRRLDPATGAPSAIQPNTDDSLEEITIIRSNWDNYMFGGQLGFNWFVQHDRCEFSMEARAFALQNFQTFAQVTSINRLLYGGVGNGNSPPDTESETRSVLFGKGEEFAFGLDIRAEAAYEITRDIRLFMGTQFIHISQGVARGNSLSLNEEDVTMSGLTFGIDGQF